MPWGCRWVIPRAKPTSIETVDDTVLQLAMEDLLGTAWVNAPVGSTPIQGINLIEFNSDPEQLAGRCVYPAPEPGCHRGAAGLFPAEGRSQIQKVYAMRKRSVGLLGNVQEKRPLPFVEDTAVPPEHLADFITEFCAALDARKLPLGMSTMGAACARRWIRKTLPRKR